MDPVISVLIVLACLLASAFFSSSETALLRLRQHEVDQDLDSADGPAPAAVRNLLANTSRLLVTILLGNNVVNILGTSVAAALAVALMPAQSGILVATLTMTVLVLVFSEILPKSIAARDPRAVAYRVALPLYIFHALMRPVHLLFDRVIEPLVVRVVGHPDGEDAASVEDVVALARRARHGQVDDAPLAIMEGTGQAAEMTVEEIMVQRTEIVAFPIETDVETLLESVLEERYTRVLIYDEDIDKILGIVHLKDLIKLARGKRRDLQSILKPVIRVPERKPILRLLQDMQRAFTHVAVVKDEFGVTQGMVTQEDILEEIVGEIRDEFDRDELLTIRELPDGCYQSLGRVSVLDFNRETGWDVPCERGDTLSGLVFNHLGRAPMKGDVVQVPGFEFTVADISGTRITHVRARRLDTAPEAAKKPNGANGYAK